MAEKLRKLIVATILCLISVVGLLVGYDATNMLLVALIGAVIGSSA